MTLSIYRKLIAGILVSCSAFSVSAQTIEQGRELYETRCRSCHGRNLEGRGSRPALDDYTKSFASFRNALINPGPGMSNFSSLSDTQMRSLYQFITTFGDEPPAPPEPEPEPDPDPQPTPQPTPRTDAWTYTCRGDAKTSFWFFNNGGFLGWPVNSKIVEFGLKVNPEQVRDDGTPKAGFCQVSFNAPAQYQRAGNSLAFVRTPISQGAIPISAIWFSPGGNPDPDFKPRIIFRSNGERPRTEELVRRLLDKTYVVTLRVSDGASVRSTTPILVGSSIRQRP